MASDPNYPSSEELVKFRIASIIAQLCGLEDCGEGFGYTFPEMDFHTSCKERFEPLMNDLRELMKGVFHSEGPAPVSQDPVVVIGSIFREVERWPASVPPGHKPTTAEEIDAFMIWVFAPRRPQLDL